MTHSNWSLLSDDELDCLAQEQISNPLVAELLKRMASHSLRPDDFNFKDQIACPHCQLLFDVTVDTELGDVTITGGPYGTPTKSSTTD